MNIDLILINGCGYVFYVILGHFDRLILYILLHDRYNVCDIYENSIRVHIFFNIVYGLKLNVNIDVVILLVVVDDVVELLLLLVVELLLLLIVELLIVLLLLVSLVYL